jgi:ribosomal protein S18 acetylase RimI-like enzyme
MIKAVKTDKAIIVDILSKSFDQNKSINFVVKQDKKRVKRIKNLMEYSFNVCSAFGEVYLTDDKKGCVLLQLPHKKKTTLNSILWDAKLGFASIGIERALKVMGRESKVHSYHPKEPFCYLWFIGVAPDSQKSGIGSALIKEVIDKFEAQDMPIYLETSTLTNLPWYQKFGFEIFQEINFTYKLFMLRRIASRPR